MNQGPYQNPYVAPAAHASAVDRRAQFIVRTYLHLFGAILAFTALEVFFFMTGIADVVFAMVMNLPWLVFLGGFMVVGWIASHFAHSAASKPAQYAGLGAYVVAEALLFVPLLYMANHYADGVISSAAAVTLLGFAGLTAVAFITKRDFSFLRGFLLWGGIVALVLIVASVIFGFSLGVLFSVGMVGLAGAAILYDTSNVLHHYPENAYVGAALQLFSSVALMLWYVISIFLSRD